MILMKFNFYNILDDEILTQDSSQNIILFDVHKSINSILAFRSMEVNKNYTLLSNLTNK